MSNVELVAANLVGIIQNDLKHSRMIHIYHVILNRTVGRKDIRHRLSQGKLRYPNHENGRSSLGVVGLISFSDEKRCRARRGAGERRARPT